MTFLHPGSLMGKISHLKEQAKPGERERAAGPDGCG